MTDIDDRFRAGLAELAQYGDAETAPARVKARVERRRRRRQRHGAIATVTIVAIAGTAAYALQSGSRSDRGAVSVSSNTTPTEDSIPNDRQATVTTTVAKPTKGDQNARTIPALTGGSHGAGAGPTGVYANPSGGAYPGSPSNGGPAAPGGNSTPTPGGAPAAPPTNPRTPPVVATPVAFPGATADHLVVVRDDNGLHESTPLIGAGAILVTYFDERAQASVGSGAVVVSPPAATGGPSVRVPYGSPQSVQMRDLGHYTVAVEGITTLALPLDVILPAGVGASTDPADLVNLTVTNDGQLVFPNRDTVPDPSPQFDHTPIAVLHRSVATLHIMNEMRVRAEITIPGLGTKVFVPHDKDHQVAVPFSQGSYFILELTVSQRVVGRAYIYVIP